jgi:hypothetical protein
MHCDREIEYALPMKCSRMNRFFTPGFNGSIVGLILGVLLSAGLDFLGYHTPGALSVLLGLLGAAFGGLLGLLQEQHSPAGHAAHLAVCLAGVVGGVGLLLGFVGPLLLDPRSSQGPLLGVFLTGPLGAAAGAVAGLVVGLLHQGHAAPGR